MLEHKCCDDAGITLLFCNGGWKFVNPCTGERIWKIVYCPFCGKRLVKSGDYSLRSEMRLAFKRRHMNLFIQLSNSENVIHQIADLARKEIGYSDKTTDQDIVLSLSKADDGRNLI